MMAKSLFFMHLKEKGNQIMYPNIGISFKHPVLGSI